MEIKSITTVEQPIPVHVTNFPGGSSRISQYKVVVADRDNISSKVQDEINAGWQPLGGVGIANDGSVLLSQALVR